jgi:Protein of unknown function (DUF1569)
MGESTMMCESEDRSVKLTHDIQVGRFGGQRQSRGGQRRLAIKSGSPQAGAGKEMSDRFQSFSVGSPVENIGAPFRWSNASINKATFMRKTLANSEHRAEIIARTNLIHSTSQRQWGRMSAHQMMCHLADSFRVTMGVKSVSNAPGAPNRLMKWLALQLPLPWPHGVKTRPEVDQLLGGTPPNDFEPDRERLLGLLDRFTRQPRDFAWHPHPMFGHMRDEEWMRWGYLHTDHHLRQFGV